MIRLAIICGAAALVLGSASPPQGYSAPVSAPSDARGPALVYSWDFGSGAPGTDRPDADSEAWVSVDLRPLAPCPAQPGEPCMAYALPGRDQSPQRRAPIARPAAPAAPALASRIIPKPVPPPRKDDPESVAAPPPSAWTAEGLGEVHVVVSIPDQRAWVFRGQSFIDSSPVSTGMRGHSTPTGTFPILQKKVHHNSNLYSNAPMPYMQRLTHSGIALHAGQLPGYPASHGCIRFPMTFAKKLYGLTRMGTIVRVVNASAASPQEALNLVLPAELPRSGAA
jgi:lipoprotein-anchoring transpeptidase ErfK/SrfK